LRGRQLNKLGAMRNSTPRMRPTRIITSNNKSPETPASATITSLAAVSRIISARSSMLPITGTPSKVSGTLLSIALFSTTPITR
jgi:hypothetical protein